MVDNTGQAWLVFKGADIHASSAPASGRDDFFPSKGQQRWLPILFELKGISAENFARGFLHPDEPLISDDALNDAQQFTIWRESVHVAGLHLAAVTPLEDVQPSSDKTYVTALVYVGDDDPDHPHRRNVFSLFGGGDDKNPRLKAVLGRSMAGSSVDEDALSPRFKAASDQSDGDGATNEVASAPDVPDAPAEKETVVVAIIDDGIAFAHERFRNAAGETRIAYTWLQGEYFDTPSTPPDIQHGREIRKADLDSRLNAETSGGLVDEHAVYRQFGVEDFGRIRNISRQGHKSTARRASHGAHVMDAAAGYPMAEDRTDRPMICVQLPTEVTADTSGHSLEPYVIQAVDYILRRADSIAASRSSGHLPVVINFSYGNATGPHDGTSVIERALDQRIRDRGALAPLRIVLPSGNSRLLRTHAQVSFRESNEATLPWRVQPNDLTWSFMEIWLPRGTPDGRVKVELTAPGSPASKVDLTELTAAAFASGSRTAGPVDLILGDGAGSRTIGSIDYAYDDQSDRGVFWLRLRPTDRIDASPDPLAPAGLYTVKLTNISFDPDHLIRAWIQRDDTPFGYPIHGRQSYFDDPAYRRYDDGGRIVDEDFVGSSVKRGGTINGLATGNETIVVGGFYRRDMRAVEFSSGGPTYDSDRVGPDVSAVSDDTPVHRGLLAAGTRSGSRVTINGTSVAAPQIARWVADELAGGSSTAGDRTAVKNRAVIEETTPPERPPRATHERGGAGRIVRPPISSVERVET